MADGEQDTASKTLKRKKKRAIRQKGRAYKALPFFIYSHEGTK
jgi:hypothetical protein